VNVKRYCVVHGVVDHDHRCGAWGVGTENSKRTIIARNHGTSTSHWKELRALALERDGHACRLQHEGCTGHATTVHIDRRLRGDHRNATLADCTSACRHCHGVEDAPRAGSRSR
jgi:5-methylcytosine-specific restriction endonuclease McrA